MTEIDSTRPGAQDRAGKYLTFKLGPGHYGLEILKVREIIGVIGVTSIPLAPDYVKGVINLRGTVIPVVDLRRKFGMAEVEATAETCIIVAHVGDREIGVLVDQVSEVQYFNAADIQDPPAFGQGIDTEFILGIGKAGDHVTLLLDINRVLNASEIADLCVTANLAKTGEWLDECKTLADKAKHLTKLGPAVQATRSSVDEYVALTAKTEDLIGKLNENRATLDKAAAAFMENANAYLDSQDEALTSEIGKGVKGGKLGERHEKITAANDIIDLGNLTRIASWRSQAQRDPQIIIDADRNFEPMAAKFDYLRARTKQEINLQQIAKTQEAGNTYRAAMKDLLANWQELQALNTKRTEVGMEVLALAQDTATAGVEGASGIAKRASASLTASSIVLLVGLVACIVIGTIAALMITRSIVGPLRRLINGLTAGSQQTASAAGQVSSASVSLADGASRQAAAIEETSSSMEEMAAMTRQNAANAAKANSLASQTKSSADRGVSAMQRMNTAIDDIKKSSDSTARIIKTIDEIAFQTNLLALNAAVEAARAGEAGKGFAVVAEEVRNLAQRSAEAAKNTAQMIEESVKNADNGVAITREVGEALSEISQAAAEVNELVAGIAKASNEQAEGNAQINTAVGQMDHITQANAANAEETASASEELSGQAEEMSSMVRELESMVGGDAARVGTSMKIPSLPVRRPAAAPKAMKAEPAAPTTTRKATRTKKVDHVIAFDEDELELVGSGRDMIDI
ncbi:MAG: chemotaxis protein CheW [bacterium]|nr:chemotaxis protein CheW [bacterium]